MKKIYYKVKYGFGPTDFVSIEVGGELERAIYAWTTRKVVTLGEKMINGNNIISIEPHYHRYTGWYDSYEPKSSEDYAQIERDCPKFDGIMSHYRERVVYLIDTKQLSGIGKNIDLPLSKPLILLENNEKEILPNK